MAEPLSAQSGIYEVPQWLEDLTNEDFSKPCTMDRFCTTCLAAFCGHCCPCHSHEQTVENSILKIVMHGACVLKNEMNSWVNCSDIEDKLCGTCVVPGSAGRKRSFLHGVALHRRMQSSNTDAGAGGKCCAAGYSGSSKYCSLECKHVLGAVPNKVVSALLEEDFKCVHFRNSFCIDCSRSFHPSFCSHHVNHTVLVVAEHGGNHCISLSGKEDWAYLFDAVDAHEVSESGTTQLLVPLKGKGPPKNTCKCGGEVSKGKIYCSAACLRMYWSAR